MKNIEFVEPTQEEKVTEHIVIDGQTIGEMVHYRGRAPGSPYHAIFSIPGNPITNLIQGHGTTKEEAIKNALFAGRLNAEAILNGIAKLEAQLSLD